MALVVVLAAALRLWHLDGVVGGFHAFNEGNYLLIAKHFLAGSPPWHPTPDGHYLFLETPPLFPLALAAVFAAGGSSVLAARTFSALISIALVVLTGLVTRRLFGPRAGVLAALVVAVAPVAVLTGRNVQTDSAYLALLLGALLLYLDGRSGRPRRTVAAGALLGLAVFTKLFALVAVPALVAWETVLHRGLGWLRERWLWLGAAVAALLPGLFYGYQAARDWAHVRTDVLGGAAAATSVPTSLAAWWALLVEAWWAVSPVLAVVLVVAVVAAVRRRPAGEPLLFVLLVAAFALFYLEVHKHSYYLLAVLVSAAPLAGRWLAGIERRALRVVLVTAVAVPAVFLSVVDLSAMKLGYDEFAELGRMAPRLGAGHVLVVDRALWASHSREVQLYDPGARVVIGEECPTAPDGRLQLPGGPAYVLEFVPPTERPAPGTVLLNRRQYVLTVVGESVLDAHPNPHFFRPGPFEVRHTGLGTGLELLASYPAAAVVAVPTDRALYRVGSRLVLRNAGG